MTPVLDLAQQLIGRNSVTPVDAGCIDLLIARLEPLAATFNLTTDAIVGASAESCPGSGPAHA